MRTRFLPTDYSTVTVAGDLEFLSLSCPRISSPANPSAVVSILRCYDELPVFEAPEDLEEWQIDDALSIFLSDVLPQFVNGDGFIGRKDSEFKLDAIETDNDAISSISTDCNQLGFMQFEVPKMDTSLLPSESPIDDCLRPLSEIPKEEFAVDALEYGAIPDRYAEVHQLVSTVDSMPDKYLVEQSAIMEDTDSPHEGINSNKNSFPLFELAMDDLGILPKLCTISELPYLDYIDKQVVEVEEVDSSNMRFSGSVKFDLMKYIVYDSAPIQQPEQGIFSSQSSIMNLAELQNSVHDSAPIIFDDILLFDSDQFLLPFGSASVLDVEHLESMFGEVVNFKGFNQLVVCHELTLMDDSFKTMPAPIFSDDGSKYSLPSLIDEILAQLNKVSLLASNDLYLDWHFREEDSFESMKHSYISEMLHKMDTSKVDAVITHDGVKLIFDFIISEDSSRETKTENYCEILNQYSTYVEEDLSSMGGQQQGKSVYQDIHQKTVVEKASMFAESMSSDLEFFLDPISHSKGKECRPGGKPGETWKMQQMLMASGSSKDVDMKIAQEALSVKLHQNAEPQSQQEQAVNQNEGCASVPGQHISMNLASEKNLSCCIVSPNTIIVMNTQSLSEEMIISRRTTYQRILEIEQNGTQVVERDIDLPIDIVISSSVCVAWYHSGNIRTKASAPDAAFSLCIESIATSVLTSLSFAFSCCILVFEGETNFIHGVMESSEELFAAAASLGIDIQIFYSYSAASTERIILSAISNAAKSCRIEYPRMPDSESLGESFLTAFPSINPLSAHAILSSDVVLGKFLEMSNDGRMCALQRSVVPKEGIVLLSAASRYGEREDSKSTTTDCSSSLSVPEYEDVRFRGESRKMKQKQKHWHNMDDTREHLKEKTFMESLKVPQNDSLNFPMEISCLSGFNEMADRSTNFCSSHDKKSLSHGTGIDMVKSFMKSSPNEFPLGKSIDAPNTRMNSVLPLEKVSYGPKNRCAPGATISCWGNGQFNKGTGFDIEGEVVDAEDTPGAFVEDLSVGNSHISSPFMLDIEKDHGDQNSRMGIVRFLEPNSPMYDAPTDFDYASGAWISGKRNYQTLMNEVIPPSETIKRGSNSIMEKKEHMRKYTTQEPFHNLPTQDAKRSSGTLLSKALESSSMNHGGSPWTMEFLNRVKEKSRLLKQSASHEVSSPSPYVPSIMKSSNFITKRKSPSVIELYKYKGTSARQKSVEQGRPKRSCLNSLQKKKAPTSSYSPTWTPVDKRARRTLAFSTNGSGGQSKLVWSENKHGSTERRF